MDVCRDLDDEPYDHDEPYCKSGQYIQHSYSIDNINYCNITHHLLLVRYVCCSEDIPII